MSQAPQVGIVGLKALTRDVKSRRPQPATVLALLRRGRWRPSRSPTTRCSLPQASGRLAGDVRVTATRSGAAVRMGRGSLRYAGWVEFGGTRRVPHTSTRPYDTNGRYLFPAACQLQASVSVALHRRHRAGSHPFQLDEHRRATP